MSLAAVLNQAEESGSRIRITCVSGDRYTGVFVDMKDGWLNLSAARYSSNGTDLFDDIAADAITINAAHIIAAWVQKT